MLLTGSRNFGKIISEPKSPTFPDSDDVFFVLRRARMVEEFESKVLLCCRKAARANTFATSNKGKAMSRDVDHLQINQKPEQIPHNTGLAVLIIGVPGVSRV
jgi:hypothetical protein